MCNEKYEQEASIVLEGGSTGSVGDRCSSNLSSWLQIADGNKSKRLSTKEVSDDRTILSAKLMGLETKWNEICQRLHRSWCFQQNVSSSTKSQVSDVYASPFTSARSECSNTDLLQENRMFSVSSSCMRSVFPCNSLSKPNILESIPSNTGIDPQAEMSIQGSSTGNLWNPSHAVSNLSLPLDHAASSSITSVTTDLGLGTIFASAVEEPIKTKFQERKDCLSKFSQGSVSADTSSGNASNQVVRSSCSSVPELGNQSDRSDFKFLLRVLSEKVSWQDEAVYAISETVDFCKNGQGRKRGSSKGSIWLSFSGPDKVGKRRIAAALAEAIFGSKLNLLRVDFDSVDKGSCSSTLFDRQDLRSDDLKLRGKTIVDYIFEELSKKPQSVVLLENIDKADFIVQNSLSQAVRNGKLPDSRGREISISNAIFVITSRELKVYKEVPSEKLHVEYPEERILAARDFNMQILVCHTGGDGAKISDTTVVTVQTRGNRAALAFGKRRLIGDVESSANEKLQIPKRARESSRSCLDLNLPVEELVEEDDCDNNSNSDSGSESSKAWLEEFLDEVDGHVSFKPFDFNALSQKVLRDISLRFQQIVGSNCLLEIDSEVVGQILAAAWLSEGKKSLEDWVEKVLCSSFKEALERYHLSPVHVIKLIPRRSLVENHAPGICLPAKITVN